MRFLFGMLREGERQADLSPGKKGNESPRFQPLSDLQSLLESEPRPSDASRETSEERRLPGDGGHQLGARILSATRMLPGCFSSHYTRECRLPE